MINVYTAIYGDYDNLLVQPEIPGVQYVCFTDNKALKSDQWDIRLREDVLPGKEPRLRAKIFKTCPHMFFTGLSVWIDGNAQITSVDFVSELSKYMKNGIALYKHPARTCVYAEAVASTRFGKYRNSDVLGQVEEYRKEGMPEKSGLWACGVLLREEGCQPLNEMWWKEICKTTIQDQLSFAYLVWKNKFEIGTIDLRMGDGTLFRLNKHLKKHV